MFCNACHKSREEDDKGACFRRGFLCHACGFYRSGETPKAKIKKTGQVPVADMPTPTDGFSIEDFGPESGL